MDLFQVYLSPREIARLDGAACTLSQAFLWDTRMFGTILIDVMNLKTNVLEILWLLEMFLII